MVGPYKAGTQCVVTNCPPAVRDYKGALDLGTIVTVDEYVRQVREAAAVRPLLYDALRNNGLADTDLLQGVSLDFLWPCRWMRPIDEDTDADDAEVVRQYVSSANRERTLQTLRYVRRRWDTRA